MKSAVGFAIRSRNIGIILRKELKELRRDRKSVMAVAMPAIFIPLLLVALMHFIVSAITKNIPDIQSPTPIGLTHLQQLPDLEAYLIEHNFSPYAVNKDIGAITENAYEEPVLVLPADTAQRFNRGDSITLTLVFDAQNKNVAGEMHRLKYLVDNFSHQLASTRLLALGIDQSLLKPLVVQEYNLMNEKKLMGALLTPLPILFMLIVFTGTIGLMVDISSGEREKRTLESLVVANPNTWVVILGKYCAGVVVLLSVLAIALLISAIGLMPIEFKKLGLGLEAHAGFWVEFLCLLLPLAVMAPAAQLAIGLHAKNFKEGQMALSILVLIAMMPNFVYMANQFSVPTHSLYIPVMYQYMAMMDLLNGIPVAPIPFASHSLVMMAMTVGLLKLSERLLRNPKILY